MAKGNLQILWPFYLWAHLNSPYSMKNRRLAFLFFIISLGLFSFRSFGQTWEVYDLQGNLKSRAVYDEVYVFSESVRIGKKDNQLFLLARNLNPIVTLEGEDVYQYLSPWILVKGKNGIGAYHEYGQQVLPAEFDEILTYTTRLLGKKGNNYFVFERGSGKTTPIGSFDNARLSHLGVVIAQKSGKYFLPQSKDPQRPYELLEENDGRYLLAKEESGFGIINEEGDYVLSPTLEQLEYTRNNHFYGFNDNQYLLIKGDEIKADVTYNSFHKITKSGHLMLEYIHGKLRRIMKEDGILLDAVGMEEVIWISGENYFVRFREQKSGLYGPKGWQVNPQSDAEWIGEGKEGLFPAKKAGKFGFINSSGEWVIPPSFEEVGTFAENLAPYKQGTKWGLINKTGDFKGIAEWKEIKKTSEGKTVVSSDEGFYLLNENGEKLNSSPFDQICRLKEGYFLVEKNGKRGILNKDGEEIFHNEYSFLQAEENDFFLLSKDGKVGAFRASGDVIFPIDYQQIIPDWSNQEILVKEAYTPVILIPEPTEGKRKKGA